MLSPNEQIVCAEAARQAASLVASQLKLPMRVREACIARAVVQATGLPINTGSTCDADELENPVPFRDTDIRSANRSDAWFDTDSENEHRPDPDEDESGDEDDSQDEGEKDDSEMSTVRLFYLTQVAIVSGLTRIEIVFHLFAFLLLSDFLYESHVYNVFLPLVIAFVLTVRQALQANC